MNRTEALSLTIWYAFLAGVVTFLYMLSIIIVDAASHHHRIGHRARDM